MAFDLAAIRTALETRLATVSGLRCYEYVPDKPEVPAAIVGPQPGEFVDFQRAFSKGLVEVRLKVMVLVARPSERAAQVALDGYISAGTGKTSSVIDAIAGDRTLGGTVTDSVVTVATDYGSVDVGPTSYGSVSFLVTAYVPRV